MQHDLSDLGSLIWTWLTPKKHTLRFTYTFYYLSTQEVTSQRGDRGVGGGVRVGKIQLATEYLLLHLSLRSNKLLFKKAYK